MKSHLTPTQQRRQQWRSLSDHEHSMDCYFSEDDLEVVYCTTCGEEW